MINSINPVKLNAIAANSVNAIKQNTTNVYANNKTESNDKTFNLQEMSQVIQNAQPKADNKTVRVVERKINEMLSDERALISAAMLGKAQNNSWESGVDMKIEKLYDNDSHKLTIKVNAKGYEKTVEKDMTPLLGKIEQRKKENEEDEKQREWERNNLAPKDKDGRFILKW